MPCENTSDSEMREKSSNKKPKISQKEDEKDDALMDKTIAFLIKASDVSYKREQERVPNFWKLYTEWWEEQNKGDILPRVENWDLAQRVDTYIAAAKKNGCRDDLVSAAFFGETWHRLDTSQFIGDIVEFIKKCL